MTPGGSRVVTQPHTGHRGNESSDPLHGEQGGVEHFDIHEDDILKTRVKEDEVAAVTEHTLIHTRFFLGLFLLRLILRLAIRLAIRLALRLALRLRVSGRLCGFPLNPQTGTWSMRPYNCIYRSIYSIQKSLWKLFLATTNSYLWCLV